MRWRKIAVAAGSGLVTLVVGFGALEWRVRPRFVAPPPPPSGVRALHEAFVLEHWGPLQPGYRTDPQALLVRAPNVHETWTWEEYPSQEFQMRTNEQGFREDSATPTTFEGPRVLVSGDSHTDGLVENAHSFANVAERELTTRLGRPVDVINAGVGYTSPRCYLGMLRKCLPLRPDVFVTVLFTGNDFIDDLEISCGLGEHPWPPEPAGYAEREERAAAAAPYFFQGLNQSYRFRTFAGEAELALSLVLESLSRIQEVCRANGIVHLLVLLPTRMDVDDGGRDEWAEACAGLGIEVRDTEQNLVLGRRLLAAARARGIECFDPSDAMRAVDVPLYWSQDHHLGLAGHEVLGRLLAERLAELLAARVVSSGTNAPLER